MTKGKTTRKQMPYCKVDNDTFSLIGTCSFPNLHKTAKQAKLDAGEAPGKFDDDVYKLSVNIDQEEFINSDLAKEAKRFIDEWYPTETDLLDGLAGIKDLNDGLEEDDKYYELNKDKFRITAKRNPNSKRNANQPKPVIFDEKKQPVTEEIDILRIENGCKVNAIVRPSAYGDYNEYVEYTTALDKLGDDVKKVKAFIAKNKQPIFGVTLELVAVQLLEARKGGAPSAASIQAKLQSNTEVSADDIDAEDTEPEVEEEVVETGKEESVDL